MRENFNQIFLLFLVYIVQAWKKCWKNSKLFTNIRLINPLNRPTIVQKNVFFRDNSNQKGTLTQKFN